jgi:hypothetical protein
MYETHKFCTAGRYRQLREHAVARRSDPRPHGAHALQAGLNEREQHRIGRAELLDTTFEVFEQKFAISWYIGRSLKIKDYWI